MRWLSRVGIVAAATLAVVVTGGLAYAPHLPRLVSEGLPPLVEPSPAAAYATVPGALSSPLPRRDGVAARIPDGRLSQILSDSEGLALIVAQHGEVRLETYRDGASAGTRFNSFSLVKGLVAALVFRAIAEQRLAGLDQPLSALLPEYPALARVTVRQLLEMRSGISGPWLESDDPSLIAAGSAKAAETSANPFGLLARLHFEGISAIAPHLSASSGSSPAFSYQNVNTALLALILTRLYERPLELVLADQLWRPAGALDALWRQPAAGQPVSAHCCLYARAEDYVKVGLYLSSNGTPDAPFLPPALWREYLGLDQDHAARRANHYGFHLWQNVLDRDGEALQGRFTYLMGQGGQLLYLMPEQGLVLYRAGRKVPLLHSQFYAAWNASR